MTRSYQPLGPTEYFQGLGNIAQQQQQIQNLQFAREEKQAEQQSIQNYLDSPSQQTLAQVASRNPQAAESIMKVNETYLKGQARKVRSMHNTWQRVPPSQKATLYNKWREQNQEDMAEYPLEYNDQTASDVDFLFNQDNENAKQILGEKPKKAVSPQGKLLEDVEAGRVPAYIARRKLQADAPAQVPTEVAQIQDKNQRADIIESVGEQNINQGNVKLGNQQLKKARTLRKEFREDEKLVEKNVQKLSSTLAKSGIVDLVSTLEDITAIINANPEDLPGMGKGAAIPAFALGTEGKILRQSVASLRNSILKARSGGAVTPQEAARLLEELGSGVGKTDEQLRIGIQKVIKRFQNNLQNIKGGFMPAAVERLAERSGSDIFNRLNALNIDISGDRAQQAPSGVVDGIKWRVK